jgi:signal peptidase
MAVTVDSSWRKRARRAGRLASGVALLAIAALAAVALVPSLVGLQRYVIVSGSMAGSYDRGSLVLDEVVPVSDLRVGDVITYRPPRDTGIDHLVTHRIAAISSNGAAQRVFRTKGDANESADPWTFTLPDARQARVRAGIPYAGYALASLTRRDVRLAIIGLPAALIAFATLLALWRRLGEEAARRAEGQPA